jgi:four helix bundle protein
VGKGDELRSRVFQFACDVTALGDSLRRARAGSRDSVQQLLRASRSIGANLEEADAAQSRPDFISKCTIALKEARESHYWLRLLQATNSRETKNVDRLVNEANELVAILTTIVKKATT